MDHFMECTEYKSGEEIFGTKAEKEEEIAIEVTRRLKMKDRALEAGPDHPQDPMLPPWL